MNFNIKDILLHIFHGGIILFCIAYAFSNEINDFLVGFFDKYNSTNISTFITATILIFISYCIGILLDPVADCFDRFIFKFVRYPSYYLLKDEKGKWGLSLAHNNKVREMLVDDIIANEFMDKQDINAIKKRKEELAEPKNALFLFQYAKSRAFANYEEYQIQRVEAYFRMSAFFRTAPLTLFLSFIIICISPSLNIDIIHFLIAFAIIVVLSILSTLANFRYRIYYCRMVLGIVYAPNKK